MGRQHNKGFWTMEKGLEMGVAEWASWSRYKARCSRRAATVMTVDWRARRNNDRQVASGSRGRQGCRQSRLAARRNATRRLSD